MSKISTEEVEQITKNVLSAISNIPNTPTQELKKAFYFKGRKSDLIAEKVISTLTYTNDLVCDPFTGGGSFLIASQNVGRRFIGSELDNYTYEVLKTLLTKCNLQKLNSLFNEVTADAKKQIFALYKTKCCNKTNHIKKLMFDPEDQEYFNPKENREIKNGHNITMTKKCAICGSKTKKFDNYDDGIMNKCLALEVSKFPQNKYIENSRINITSSTGADNYDRIFTQRNKYALLILQNSILKLPPSIERDVLEHILVVSLALSRIAMYGSSTDILYHVVPEKAQEMNVWTIFEDNYKDIIKFKKKYAEIITSTIINEQFKLYNCDFRELKKILGKNKVDFIYTDFPYTDQVPYLERNQLFRIWLEKFYDHKTFKLTDSMLDSEIIVSNAPSRRNKNLENYYKDVDAMFSTFYDILKDNHYLTFTIKLGKVKYITVYSQIVNLARKNGFELVTRIGLEKSDPTLRKQSAYTNTFMNEMIVVLKKLPESNKYWYVGNYNYEYIATKLIYTHLTKKSNSNLVTVTAAAKLLINDLRSRGHLYNEKEDDDKILHLLRSNFSIRDGYIFIDGNRLYIEIEDDSTLFSKLYDIIPIYIRQLLESQNKFVLEDLYFKIIGSLCDGEPGKLSQILSNQRYKDDITCLIKNYCDISNGYYVSKNNNFKASKDAIDISQLSGTEFETLMRIILLAEGYINVVIRGGAGDRGVDIVATKIINKKVEKTVFQCKRWIGNVGSEPIQRLYAEQQLHHFDHAICITTSDYTKDGTTAASDFHIDTWNGKDVLSLLNKHFPGKYFNRAI